MSLMGLCLLKPTTYRIRHHTAFVNLKIYNKSWNMLYLNHFTSPLEGSETFPIFPKILKILKIPAFPSFSIHPILSKNL